MRTLLSLDVHWMPIVHRASGCIAMRVFRVGGGRWWCLYCSLLYCTRKLQSTVTSKVQSVLYSSLYTVHDSIVDCTVLGSTW